MRRRLDLTALWAAITWALLSSGCPETVRCPDGEVFDDDGRCVAIPDAGPGVDAGPEAADGG